MKTFYIYFSDLNDEAQKELLDLVRAKDATEMNWDLDIVPLASIDFEEDLDDEEDEE